MPCANAFSGNKGEWSEPYVVLKLAADGILRQADDNMRPSADEYVRVVKIAREDLSAELNSNGDSIFSFVDSGGLRRSCRITRGDSVAKAAKLLHSIRAITKKKGAFAIPSVRPDLIDLGFNQLKNPVPRGHLSIKRDLQLIIDDTRTGTRPKLGFSVKSELGNAPTLLNASKHTNFIYRVKGITDEQMNRVNAINSSRQILDRCAMLNRIASAIEFDGLQSDTFRDNLELIDGDLPTMLADTVKEHYLSGDASLSSVIGRIGNSPRYVERRSFFCAVKIKRLLRACALGMIPSQPWNDLDDATGGYIIVLPDGELVAFCIYNRALFDKYLFENTNFEHASTGRHDYGRVYKIGSEHFVKLNLQIRFVR